MIRQEIFSHELLRDGPDDSLPGKVVMDLESTWSRDMESMQSMQLQHIAESDNASCFNHSA